MTRTTLFCLRHLRNPRPTRFPQSKFHFVWAPLRGTLLFGFGGIFSSDHFKITSATSRLFVPSIIMCEKCTEKLQGKLSRKTREAQGDFIKDNFPGVPEGLDVTPSPSLVLG